MKINIKIRIAFSFLLLAFIHSLHSQNPPNLSSLIPDWFQNAKFGVFVHFGENGHFRYYTDPDKVVGTEHNPEAYTEGALDYTLQPEDVAVWVEHFSDWGAKYAVLTTKHRPGFALWDTKVHSRNIAGMSPAGFDLVEVWTDELRRKDIKVGYYFSHYDWGDEDFITAKNPPSTASEAEKQEAWKRYLKIRDKMVSELVSDYGKIDLIWWDEDWCAKDYIELGSDPLLDLVFEKQPGIVVNNRCRHPWRWHYGSPEKYVPLIPPAIPWESCDNLSQSNGWGYRMPDGYSDYKTKEDILLTFLDVISGGGNYLLNIGPKPDGEIPREELEILDFLGNFITKYPEAIYGTRRGIPRVCYGDPSTTSGKELFLFAVNRPDKELTIKGIEGSVEKVTRLKTGEELEYRLTGGRPGHGRPAWIRITVPESDDIYPEVYKVVFEEGFQLEKSLRQ